MMSMADDNTSTDQRIYSLNPNEYLESPDDSLYVDHELSAEEALAVKETRSKKAKKTTAVITTIAATLVAGAIGVVGIVNPLINRPKITNGSYKLVGSSLKYEFKYSATNNYHSSLLLYLGEEKMEKIDISTTGTITGEITLVDHGQYRLDLFSTNNIDYTKQIVLYTFLY